MEISSCDSYREGSICRAELEIVHRHYHYDPFDQYITTDQTASICKRHLEDFLKHIVELKRFIISIKDVKVGSENQQRTN